MPLRPRHGYAADLHRGLPTSARQRPKGVPRQDGDRYDTHIEQVLGRAGTGEQGQPIGGGAEHEVEQAQRHEQLCLARQGYADPCASSTTARRVMAPQAPGRVPEPHRTTFPAVTAVQAGFVFSTWVDLELNPTVNLSLS